MKSDFILRFLYNVFNFSQTIWRCAHLRSSKDWVVMDTMKIDIWSRIIIRCWTASSGPHCWAGCPSAAALGASSARSAGRPASPRAPASGASRPSGSPGRRPAAPPPRAWPPQALPWCACALSCPSSGWRRGRSPLHHSKTRAFP